MGLNLTANTTLVVKWKRQKHRAADPLSPSCWRAPLTLRYSWLLLKSLTSDEKGMCCLLFMVFGQFSPYELTFWFLCAWVTSPEVLNFTVNVNSSILFGFLGESLWSTKHVLFWWYVNRHILYSYVSLCEFRHFAFRSPTCSVVCLFSRVNSVLNLFLMWNFLLLNLATFHYKF